MKYAASSLVRFPHQGGKSNFKIAVRRDHPSLVNGTTIFKAKVSDPTDARLFKSGHSNSKIGKLVVKGAWSGFPIFTLTLEERATCPRSCLQWDNCYGNNLHFSKRWRAGPDLELRVWQEITELQARYPGGFVVRLHVLGDFYSVDYVGLWRTLLDACPALHVFGYTARIDDGDPIVPALAAVCEAFPERWWIRQSGGAGEMATEVVEHREDASPGAIVCPQQEGKTLACGTCALCWSTTRNIAFLKH